MKPPSEEEALQILNDVRDDLEDRRTLRGKYAPTPGVCRVCAGKVVPEIGFPDDGLIGGPPRRGHIAGWHCEECHLSYWAFPPDPITKEAPPPMSDDEKLEKQLKRCGINLLPGKPLVGQLGSFTFRFSNYYWIASGPMPLLLAREIYDHPVGKDIRAGGDGPGRHPEVYCTTYFAADGTELLSDPDGSQEKQLNELVEKGVVRPALMKSKRFVPDAKGSYAYAQVLTYHIDSELGLYVFAEFARRVR